MATITHRRDGAPTLGRQFRGPVSSGYRAICLEMKMLRSWSRLCVNGLVVLGLASGAFGQAARQAPTVLPNRPADNLQQGLLGQLFESKAAGILFRAPANTKEVRRQGIPDLIVEFVNDSDQLLLRAGTLELREDRKLDDFKDAAGKQQRGLLNETIDTFKNQAPTSEVIRNEVKTINGQEMGLLAFRFSQGTSRKLMQKALIPMPKSYRNYYELTLFSPAAKSGETGVDEKEKFAADTFSDVLDSVRLIDRSEIVKDQKQRLINTEAILESLRQPKAAEQVLIPEQYLRLMRDGKDIGYTYVVEERAKEDGREGILVSTRSHTVPTGEQAVDATSRLFIAKEWAHEAWSHVVSSMDKGKPVISAELGLSDLERHYTVDQPADLLSQPATDKTSKEPDLKEYIRYKLQVRSRFGTTIQSPYEQTMPQAYLPQAIRHLLPRILAGGKKQGYMFVCYVSELHEPMTLYIDVGEETELNLDGRVYKVIPVQDRIGLEGAPTTYYITPDGKYLGSQTVVKIAGQESLIRVIPTDEATLRKLWKNVNLQKPSASDVPDVPTRKK